MNKVTQDFLSSLIDKTIIFNRKIVDWESYAEPNMKAIVKKFTFDDSHNEPVHKIWVDFSPFEEENHKLQNANYYDNNGNATLTAVEAGFYFSLDDVYIDENIDALPFVVLEDNKEADMINRITKGVMFFVDSSRFSEKEIRETIKNAIDNRSFYSV